jgi:hypothetical protein
LDGEAPVRHPFPQPLHVKSERRPAIAVGREPVNDLNQRIVDW